MNARRTALGALLALLAVPVPAHAAPLAGEGRNIQPIATLELGDGQKNEIELAGDYAYVSGDYGVAVVNIADPAKPFVAGRWDCKGGSGDMDINATATVAVVANAHEGDCAAKGGGTSATILDISDPKNPHPLSHIDLDDQIEYTHTTTIDGTTLYLNPQVWLGYPQTKIQIAVYDISVPAHPKRTGFITSPGPGLAHDTYVDHRPDGRTLMYAASMHSTDVFDLSDPMKPTMLQQAITLDSTISHQAEPNYKRDIIVMDDESAVDIGAPVGAICARIGAGPLTVDVGSLHFFAANPDGTIKGGGLTELGSWNTGPLKVDPNTCTGHVFWQAPDENRLTQAWYSEGAHILDFSDPANPIELGSFKASPSTMYWSAKPHRGYIFATDMDRGLDVLKYTGEDGKRWPATAGPAEVQRAKRMGVTLKPAEAPLPAPTVPKRKVGRFTFTVKVRKAATKLKLVFRRAGKNVAVVAVPKKHGTKVTVRGIAVAGSYRWSLRWGTKTLRRGVVRVKQAKNVRLVASAKMSATAK